MKMTRLRRLISLVVYGCLSWASSTYADAVVDWNKIMVDTFNANPAGRISLVEFAIVHVAIYDAVQAIEGQFEPYHVIIPGATGSAVAAAATAAHDVLVSLFPAQTAALDTTYLDYLAAQGLLETDPGIDVGQRAAAGILALRANDGRLPPNPPDFTGGPEPGVWRPTPPAFAPGFVPWLATVTPFALESPSQFRADPPPELSSKRYAKDYKEVKALGALLSSVRTPEQTDIGYFWAANTPVVWNLAFEGIANTYIDNISDSARFFALLNFAGSDAFITSWDTKYTYVFWRPITAIQEGDNDGNPKTVGDPAWQPLINTPNYPDYSAGAPTYASAVTHMLELFFKKNKITFSVTTTNPLAVRKTRTYTRFSDAAEEVVEARIYAGFHFRTADEVGWEQGRRVAKWAFKHVLRPVRH